MFADRCFYREWIVQEARRQGTQAVVLEKCIHALLLVGRLRATGLDFVFKGGTSLMLHLEPIRRLSIDVDIASLEPLEKVQQAMDQVCDGAHFERWAHQDWRNAEDPPTKYFQLFYTSALDGTESSVQLDVLEIANGYAQVLEKPVRTSFLEVLTPMTAPVPTIEGLLGDKLAAFAPSTIGVLYQPVSRRSGDPTEPKPIRVMKQLFDVGELFTHSKDMDLVAETYRTHFDQQNSYRGGGFTLDQALEDSIDAAYWLSQIDFKPVEENDKTTFFRRGHTAINTHLIGERYTLQHAKVSAARAALLATAIKTDRLEIVRELPPVEVLRGLRIEGRWSKLQVLRNTSPEAFYLWYQAHLLDRGV
jgi:hypothetical protein